MNNSLRWEQLKETARTQLIVIGGFIAFIWLLELVDQFIFHGGLDSFGIRPRSVNGLSGIFFAPLLHGGFGHLMANTVPLVVLGWLVLTTRKLSNFILISLTIIVIAGLGTWLIGSRASVHIGASGLVFGYFGYLLATAYFDRSFSSLALALVVIFFYGGMIFGILPRGNGISWQSHLFGLVGGGTAAYLMGRLPVMSPPTIEEQITIL